MYELSGLNSIIHPFRANFLNDWCFITSKKFGRMTTKVVFFLLFFTFLALLPTFSLPRFVLAWIWWFEYPWSRRETTEEWQAVKMAFMTMVRGKIWWKPSLRYQINTNKVTPPYTYFLHNVWVMFQTQKLRKHAWKCKVKKLPQWVNILFILLIHQFWLKSNDLKFILKILCHILMCDLIIFFQYVSIE